MSDFAARAAAKFLGEKLGGVMGAGLGLVAANAAIATKEFGLLVQKIDDGTATAADVGPGCAYCPM